ncbi:hypothetical protein I7I53_00142 [Histoplasma capsulatum var. duboisii H88]|uniref:Uncharacterized protein n=1 Tax=Ajellomyces capsulatus (strain H88) TaxID=544711 RepID=A0A8A1LHN4_AJEC8|nr:hypothetical protein I7I53_00142 [Histoplasma capsulatum var. duboisii H88]
MAAIIVLSPSSEGFKRDRTSILNNSPLVLAKNSVSDDRQTELVRRSRVKNDSCAEEHWLLLNPDFSLLFVTKEIF